MFAIFDDLGIHLVTLWPLLGHFLPPFWRKFGDLGLQGSLGGFWDGFLELFVMVLGAIFDGFGSDRGDPHVENSVYVFLPIGTHVPIFLIKNNKIYRKSV